MSGPTTKSEFRNTRDFHIGVVLKREDGRTMKGMALEPGGRVWMDEEEQMATANAPRKESDNPFTNGDLELVQSATAKANRRPIGDTVHPDVQETGGQVAEDNPEPPSEAAEPAAEPEAAGATSDGEAAPASEGAAEEPQAAGKRTPTKEEAEESARNAAARRRPSAPGDPSHTGSPPAPAGKPVEGSRAAAEEVATPQAVPAEK